MDDYVDIIIVNYNTQRFLHNCIESIKANTQLLYRLIIVDNASTDGSKSYLARLKASGVVVMENERNVGCAKAWNQGIRRGQGKYILLLNPDTLVKAGWLEAMVQCAESDAKIAVVGNKQINEHGVILHAGVVEVNGQAVLRSGGQDSPGRYAEVCDCIDVCGACYLIKRENLATIGYFDERFFLYAEETDYSFRARQLGYRVVYCPVTIIHFKDGAPINAVQRERIHRESCRLFDEKWLGRG